MKEAVYLRSRRAFELAAAGEVGRLVTLPQQWSQKIGLEIYVNTDWRTYLTTRGFIDGGLDALSLSSRVEDCDTTAAELVLSAALTHPLTIARGIGLIASEVGVKKARELLVRRECVDPHRNRVEDDAPKIDLECVNIAILGARAEAMVPLWAWQELALACANILGVGRLSLSFCGPDLAQDGTSKQRAVKGNDVTTRKACLNGDGNCAISPMRPSAPVSCKGPNNSDLSVTLQHFEGLYQDLAWRRISCPVQEFAQTSPTAPCSVQTRRSLAESASFHCLLNPGVSHPEWKGPWTAALETVRDIGVPVLMTSFDSMDDEGDRARSLEVFGAALSSSESYPYSSELACGNTSSNIKGAPNPFRSFKFDELWERSPKNAASSTECIDESATAVAAAVDLLPSHLAHEAGARFAAGSRLRLIQSNWSARVYLPQHDNESH